MTVRSSYVIEKNKNQQQRNNPCIFTLLVLIIWNSFSASENDYEFLQRPWNLAGLQ